MAIKSTVVTHNTTTGFIIRRGYQMSGGGLVDLQWKAEEK